MKNKRIVRTFGQARALEAETFTNGLIEELSRRMAGFSISDSQLEAWRLTFGWLHESITSTTSAGDDWLVLPEFNPPLAAIRPDLVLVSQTHTAILEFKTGSSPVGKTAKTQLQDYAQVMWQTMQGVRDTELLATLVSPAIRKSSHEFRSWTQSDPTLIELSPTNLPKLIASMASSKPSRKIDLDTWLRPTYDLHPDIITAASEMIAHVEDRGITTHLSDDDELEEVRKIVLNLINSCRQEKTRQIILISGVPGAGKTLIGLRLAHDPELRDSLPADAGTPLYLTGNGPLVDVLVEAVARDDQRRNPEKKISRARTDASSKIKLVHGITEGDLATNTHIVVFDEGQRIWTAEHMVRKGKSKNLVSEAEWILKELEGHNRDWVTLVVLIGSGQEINVGEAGAVTWLEAASQRTRAGTTWHVVAPAELKLPTCAELRALDGLNLKVSRRAASASLLSKWVSLLLDGKISQAKKLRTDNPQLAKFPIYLTRDLGSARAWLWKQIKSESSGIRLNAGLVASSKSSRLRAFGLEVGNQPRDESVDWTKWFLDPPISLHSSSRLEVAASEFKTQGLELDYVGVAWSWDLILKDENWVSRNVNKSTARWSENKSNRQLLINAYRVLLTRARRGLVVWVPNGSEDDPSLPPDDMDVIYQTLIKAGAHQLPAGDF